MARASQPVERKSMYACDYDNLGPMGTLSVFEEAPSKLEIERIQQITSDCEDRLCEDECPMLEKDKADKAFVMDMWLYRFDECATELRGSSVSDKLFIARCNLLCCEFPKIRDMSVLNDIHELYVRLQLLGTNHTRARFNQQESDKDVEQLEFRCASLIVFAMDGSTEDLIARFDGPLPKIDALLAARVNPLRNVPDIIVPTEEELKEAAVKKAAEKAKLRKENPGVTYDDDSDDEAKDGAEFQYDVNEGNYWHSDKDTVIRGFVRMASRVFRNYWLQRTIFEKYPLRDFSKLPEYSENVKKQFTVWLEEQTKCDYANDAVKLYRDLVYEHWLPDGSRQEMLRYFRSKYDIMNPLNLLENQLGVTSATSLANMARVQTKVVATSAASETYDLLLLSQFGELMRLEKVDTFFDKYYIRPGDLCKLRKRLDCTHTWGVERRPILLRIRRGWFIHDAGEWVMCTDMRDALLKLMTLWRTKYDSYFAGNHNPEKLEKWIKRVTEPRNDDEYIEDGGMDSDDD